MTHTFCGTVEYMYVFDSICCNRIKKREFLKAYSVSQRCTQSSNQPQPVIFPFLFPAPHWRFKGKILLPGEMQSSPFSESWKCNWVHVNVVTAVRSDDKVCQKRYIMCLVSTTLCYYSSVLSLDSNPCACALPLPCCSKSAPSTAVKEEITRSAVMAATRQDVGIHL